MHLSLRGHIFLSLAALFILVLGGWNANYFINKIDDAPKENDLQTISFIHSSPASVRLEYGTKGKSAIAVVYNIEEISVFVPEYWQLRESKGIYIENELNKQTGNRMTGWHMSNVSGIQFWIQEAPKHLVIHNSKNAPLKIELIRINMETEEKLHDVFLVDDSPLQLW